MTRYNWGEVPEEKMNDLLSRWVIHTPEMTIARLFLAKGAFVPTHVHSNAQTVQVTTGALLFKYPGADGEQEVILRDGDVLVIPPSVPHSAEALEDTVAVDTFTPARQDWIDGDDSYLRK